MPSPAPPPRRPRFRATVLAGLGLLVMVPGAAASPGRPFDAGRSHRGTAAVALAAQTSFDSLPQTPPVPGTPPGVQYLDPASVRAEKARAERSGVPKPKPQPRPGSSAPATPPVLTEKNVAGVAQARACGTCARPDLSGAVGPMHYMQVVTNWVRIFKKSSLATHRRSARSLSAFFDTEEFLFLPRVLYDDVWGRWIAVATRRADSGLDEGRRVYLAVSRTNQPNREWYVYQVTFGGGPFAAGDWWDYPQLGFDQDAIVVTGNVYREPGPTYTTTALIAIPKARVYNGLGLQAPVLTNLRGTLSPSVVLDQSPGMYLLTEDTRDDRIVVTRCTELEKPAAASCSVHARIFTPMAPPPDAAQPGTALLIDTLDARFQSNGYQLGDRVWNAHSEAFGSFAGLTYYEIDAVSRSIVSTDQWYSSVTSDDFNPSIAVNRNRDLVVTWTSTDAAGGLFPQVLASGLQASDPPDVPVPGAVLADSPTFHSRFEWGSYSAVAIDPQDYGDGCGPGSAFWVTNEKVLADGTWGTQVGMLKFC